MALKKNLDQLIFEQMKDRIINGDWEPGVILDVDELAARYEVSRTPILQALKRMQNEGILTASRNGKFSFPRCTAGQIVDICRVRLVLEREALEDIRRKDLRVDMASLEDIARRCYDHNVRGDVIASRRYDMEWHKRLVDASRNECLIGIYTKVQSQFMVANYLQASHSQEQQRVAADDHLRILESLREEDFEGALSILTDHIETARDKVLARVRSAVAVSV